MKAEHVSARLIVRRVKRLNPRHGDSEQGGLLEAYHHHAVLIDSPLSMLEAEVSHRDHAIVEQVIVDLKNGPKAARYLGLDVLARCRLTLTNTSPVNEVTTETLPALTT